MKRITKCVCLLLLVCTFCFLVLTGCGEKKSGSTISEPKITGEYLSEEYSKQLITDGAETMTGFVEVSESEGSYKITLTEKEVVPNSSYEDGYYIADTNLTKDLTFGMDPRIACIDDGKLQVETPDEFMEYTKQNPEQLYKVYVMGSSAELILETSPEEVIMEEN